MRIWLIQVGEPLPLPDQPKPRLLRTGLLAEQFVALGHEVTWWVSTFDHFQKHHVRPPGTVIRLDNGVCLEFLHGIRYPTNVSPRRIINHRQLAHDFRARAHGHEPPGLVLTSLPPVELAAEAVRYAKTRRIPVIVDVRDLWPDALIGLAPRPLRGMVRMGLGGMTRDVRRALRDTTGILAVSQSYLDWSLRHAGRPGGLSDRVYPLGYPRLFASPASLTAARDRLITLGLDPRRHIVWFVGTFGQSYDLTTVLEAARLLHQQRVESPQFVLSGTGDQETRLRQRAAGLPNVIFTGWVDQATIAALMERAWVGIAPYAENATQSLPNKLFEYLSAGLPVLSSLRGETESFLASSGCGVSYQPGNAPHLAAVIRDLATSPEARRHMAERSRAVFDERFDAAGIYRDMAGFAVAIATAQEK